MKKIVYVLLGVLISSSLLWSQEDIIKKVNIEINKEKPDYDEARLLIRKALNDESTKHDAKTWLTAAEIGYKEYTQYNTQAAMGQMIDEERRGEAIIESYNYLLKADSIAMIPTTDKKGKSVVDTKTRSKVVKMLQEYYTTQDIVRYGVFLNEHQDYNRAYVAFKTHVSIPELPMMRDSKIQSSMPRDTTYYQYYYYAGLFAIQSKHHKEAISIFKRLTDSTDAKENMYQFLYQEYIEVGDSAKAFNTLIKASKKYPKDAWFTQNIINHYIANEKYSEAQTYLDKVIKQQPKVAQYHYIKGNIAERLDNPDMALAEFDKALEIDPKLAGAYAGKARLFYNKAVKKQEQASTVSDQEYVLWNKEIDDLFRKSIPLFEKAHQLDKNNAEYMKTLKYLYQRFSMNDKYKAIESELGF